MTTMRMDDLLSDAQINSLRSDDDFGAKIKSDITSGEYQTLIYKVKDGYALSFRAGETIIYAGPHTTTTVRKALRRVEEHLLRSDLG